MYLTCQVHQSIGQSLSNGSPITVNDPSRPEEESRGCPICDPAPAGGIGVGAAGSRPRGPRDRLLHLAITNSQEGAPRAEPHRHLCPDRQVLEASERGAGEAGGDRKSTRLNSSHSQISYAVFCLKKKKITAHDPLRTSVIDGTRYACSARPRC